MSRRVHDIEEDSDRRTSMLQDRLDSTINRYEEQLQLLRRQKARVEDDLDRERRAGCKCSLLFSYVLFIYRVSRF